MALAHADRLRHIGRLRPFPVGHAGGGGHYGVGRRPQFMAAGRGHGRPNHLEHPPAADPYGGFGRG